MSPNRTRTFALLVLGFVALAPCHFGVAQQAVPLLNPSFEEPDPQRAGMPLGWGHYPGTPTDERMAFTWDDAQAHTGRHSVCLAVGSSGTSWLPLDTSAYANSLKREDLDTVRPTATVGHEYVLAAWVKAEGSAQQGAALVLRWTNGKGWVPEYTREYFRLDGSNWQLIAVSATAPEGALNVVPILQVRGSTAPGRIWFDDVSLADRAGLSLAVTQEPALAELPDRWQCQITVTNGGEAPMEAIAAVGAGGAARPTPTTLRPKTPEVIKAQYIATGSHRVQYVVTSPDDPPTVYFASAIDVPAVLDAGIVSPRYRSTIYGQSEGRSLVVSAHARATDGLLGRLALRVRLLADEKVLAEQTHADLQREQVLTLPLPAGLDGEYVVQATLLSGEAVVDETRLPFRCLATVTPHAMIGDWNELIVDGKPVFPIGFYSTLPEDFKRFSQDGFNTVLTYTSDVEACARMAEQATEAGLNLIVSALQPAREKRDAEHVRSAAERLAGIPGLLGYYLCDEPTPSRVGQTPEDMRWLYQQAVKEDPGHLTCTVFCVPSEFGLYADTTDVYLVDPYPTHRDREADLTMVARWVDAAREALRDRKPVWLVPQAFDHLLGPGTYRMPTVEEQRCMTYLGLVHGAKGVLWFVYTGFCIHSEEVAKQKGLAPGEAAWVFRGTIPQCFPLRYEGMKHIVREVTELAPVLLAEDPEQAQEVRQGAEAVHTLLKAQGDQRYLFAVNTEDAPVEFACTLPEVGAEVDVLWEGRTAKTTEGALKDSFKPYEVHVYRYEVR
jgi:hypothetical protein